MLTPLFVLLTAVASAQVCPSVTVSEVTTALTAVGETARWAIEGPVQPYPNVPYSECHYVAQSGKLNRQVLIQVRPTDAGEVKSIKHFVDQVSRTNLAPPRAVENLGDEAWFYVDGQGIGQLNVRKGQAVVHVAVDLQTKSSEDQAKKLAAGRAVAAHALQRLQSGEISVTKK